MQLGLVPVVPILLFPFIILFFIVIFPLWLVAIAVLGLVLGLARVAEAGLALIGVKAGKRLSGGPTLASRADAGRVYL
jgi:hypothetical protein